MNPRTRARLRLRGAFTMTELLVAATVTSLTAAAGATFISGISNAATQTRDVRAAKTAGTYALGQIVRTIREARGIGQVAPASITLWLRDTNGDDRMNLYEVGTIRYDSAAKRILYEYMQPPTPTSPSGTVITDDFRDISLLRTRTAIAERREAIWAEDVQSLSFQGYPAYTDTRVVDVRLETGADSSLVFRGSASPRAAADYLFYVETQDTAPTGSVRRARKYVSPYKGLTNLASQIGAMTEMDL